MDYLTPRQRAVIAELRAGQTNPQLIAQALEEPPFAIRAELQALKRLQVARLHFTHRSLEWRLTDRGQRYAYTLDQQELFR